MQNKLTLQKFGHKQCNPCVRMQPVLEQISTQYKDIVDVQDKDTTTLSVEELISASIKSVPTLIILKDGVEQWRRAGFMDYNSLKEEIDKHLS